MRVELWREEDSGDWAFVVLRGDGSPIARGEGYTNRETAERHAHEIMRRTYEQESMGLPW